MVEKLFSNKTQSGDTLKRTLAKTISYRVIILILDFTSIYLFTGKIKVAVGFMVVSNIYTTIVYFIHELIWDKFTNRKSKKTTSKQVEAA